jgi:tetratricopeptide (TPR) repeat protein
MKIGDALIGRGAVADAVARYRAALERRERAHTANWPSAYDAKLAVAEAVARLCTTLAAVGDVPGAIASCRRNLELTDQLLAEKPDARNLRVMRAANVTSHGNLLRMTRAFDASAALLDDAVRQYRDLIATGRPDQELRRRLAVAYGYLASVRLELKDPVAAAETFRLSTTELEALATADRSNVRPRIELAYMLNRRAQVLTGLRRMAEARQDAGRALTVLREAAERPEAGGEVLNEYAWTLVSTEPVELRDPARALRFVDRAITRAGSPNAMFLHTRAWALYRLRRVDEAVAEADRALQLLPAQGASVGLKRQIEATRAAFRR